MLKCISTAHARTKCGHRFWARHFSCKFRYKVGLMTCWRAFRLCRLAQSARLSSGLGRFSCKYLYKVALVKCWSVDCAGSHTQCHPHPPQHHHPPHHSPAPHHPQHYHPQHHCPHHRPHHRSHHRHRHHHHHYHHHHRHHHHHHRHHRHHHHHHHHHPQHCPTLSYIILPLPPHCLGSLAGYCFCKVALQMALHNGCLNQSAED